MEELLKARAHSSWLLVGLCRMPPADALRLISAAAGAFWTQGRAVLDRRSIGLQFGRECTSCPALLSRLPRWVAGGGGWLQATQVQLHVARALTWFLRLAPLLSPPTAWWGSQQYSVHVCLGLLITS